MLQYFSMWLIFKEIKTIIPDAMQFDVCSMISFATVDLGAGIAQSV
jgi:hypothetical protein